MHDNRASWGISQSDPRALLDTCCAVSALARTQDSEFSFQFQINNLPGASGCWCAPTRREWN